MDCSPPSPASILEQIEGLEVRNRGPNTIESKWCNFRALVLASQSISWFGLVFVDVHFLQARGLGNESRGEASALVLCSASPRPFLSALSTSEVILNDCFFESTIDKSPRLPLQHDQIPHLDSFLVPHKWNTNQRITFLQASSTHP